MTDGTEGMGASRRQGIGATETGHRVLLAIHRGPSPVSRAMDGSGVAVLHDRAQMQHDGWVADVRAQHRVATAVGLATADD